MKRLISIAVAILAVCLGLAVWSENLQKSQGDTGDNTLNLFNWGDYIDPELLDEFTAETGIQVDYQTFDSNESMYTKIKQGGNNLRFSSSIRIYDFQNDGRKYAG